MVKKIKKTQLKKKKKSLKLEGLGWNTTDADEIERRRWRARVEKLKIKNTFVNEPYFSTFLVNSRQNNYYEVEIRSLSESINACNCPDYTSHRLGTCKHIEAVLLRLKKQGMRAFKQAQLMGSPHIEIFLDRRDEKIHVLWPAKPPRTAHRLITHFFSTEGYLLGNPLETYEALKATLHQNNRSLRKSVRLSRHVESFIDYQQQQLQKQVAKEIFLKAVDQGKWTLDVMKYPLYPYQQVGMLHLAFTERALLADEMGLGKTVQAIAACELLRQHKNIQRVLVIATASLKSEWEEQIAKFSNLSSCLIQGTRPYRLQQYQSEAFFYLAHYEQVVVDGAEMQRLIAPDVIILDEAQRIKNWQTKTACAVKQLKSHYAFVLTGTPLENRIDDVYSITQFLDARFFGSLFQFNRDFYELDEKGKPVGYKNLDALHQRLQPIMLRRRKHDVEGQLPDLTVNHYFVKMEKEQRLRYGEYESRVARLVAIAQRRPLYKEEFEKLQKWLACMRMLCDTPYILDPTCRISPKLLELGSILEELLVNEESKIIIFSEWERMLQLVREKLQKMDVDFAWHTGKVPVHKRREIIQRFKTDPHCRLFLSTDSGGLGLNLQQANVVINLDLPWNPAKLDQRIARAWRKHQMRPVQVIHLVCENSIEHRMLALLDQKKKLAEGVLEGSDAVKAMKLPSGRAAFMERMAYLMDTNAINTTEGSIVPQAENTPADPLERMCHGLLQVLPEQIDLLQVHHDQKTGQKTLWVVVDQLSDAIEKQVQTINEQTDIVLKTLNRQTFESLQHLAENGFITLNQPFKILHTSSHFSHLNNKSLAKKQIEQAQSHLEKAAYQHRMATVLLDSAFHREAIAPLREALSLTVQAFAYMKENGQDQILPAVISEAFIQENLINQHGLPQEAHLLLTQWDKQADQLSPDQVKQGMISYQNIFQYVDEACHQIN